MDNVSLKHFGTHMKMNAMPLRWHDTLALMIMDLIHKLGRHNVVLDVLNRQEKVQAMSTTQLCG